jgi:hypothetical protein
MERHVVACAMACGVLVAAGDAAAQQAQRREALAKVVEGVNDPDPLMRIANLEDILARGNATETQLAIKAAMAGNDPELRSIALRGYMVSTRDLYLDSRPAPEVQRRVEDPDAKEQEIATMRSQIAQWRAVTGDRLHVRLDKLDARTGRFSAYGMNQLDKLDERVRGDGNIVGSRIRMSFAVWNLRRCTVDLAPTSALTLEGSATCDNMPRMLLTMPMF